jgi:hypothetical protein
LNEAGTEAESDRVSRPCEEKSPCFRIVRCIARFLALCTQEKKMATQPSPFLIL